MKELKLILKSDNSVSLHMNSILLLMVKSKRKFIADLGKVRYIWDIPNSLQWGVHCTSIYLQLCIKKKEKYHNFKPFFRLIFNYYFVLNFFHLDYFILIFSILEKKLFFFCFRNDQSKNNLNLYKFFLQLAWKCILKTFKNNQTRSISSFFQYFNIAILNPLL